MIFCCRDSRSCQIVPKMQKIDSWQNFTSIWWSNFFLNFYFFIEKKNILKMQKIFFVIFNRFSMKSYLNSSMKPCLGSSKISLKIGKNIFYSFKMIFFNEKIKVEKKIGSLYRCRFLSGIDFSHPRSDLATPLGARTKNQQKFQLLPIGK